MHPAEAADETNKTSPAVALGPKKPPRRRNRNAHRPYPSQHKAASLALPQGGKQSHIDVKYLSSRIQQNQIQKVRLIRDLPLRVYLPGQIISKTYLRSLGGPMFLSRCGCQIRPGLQMKRLRQILHFLHRHQATRLILCPRPSLPPQYLFLHFSKLQFRKRTTTVYRLLRQEALRRYLYWKQVPCPGR